MTEAANGNKIWTSSVTGIALLLTVAGAFWTVFQSQLSHINRDLDAINERIKIGDADQKASVATTHSELLSRNQIFINRAEFSAFEKRLEQYMAVPYMPRNEFIAWQTERGKLIELILARIQVLETKYRTAP